MPEQLDIDLALVQEAAAAENPAAMALLAGRLVMTVQSKKSGEHITIKADARVKASRWVRANFAQATHVFVSVPRPDGEFPDKVGTYYPTGRQQGKLWAANNADRARVWTAALVLKVASGLTDWETDQYEVMQNTYCLYCGRELTDPVSIRRQIGPECSRTCSSAMHQMKDARHEVLRTSPLPPVEIEPDPGTDARDPERAGATWSSAESEPPAEGLQVVRPGESATAAYQAMLAQENAAEQAEADQS